MAVVGELSGHDSFMAFESWHNAKGICNTMEAKKSCAIASTLAMKTKARGLFISVVSRFVVVMVKNYCDKNDFAGFRTIVKDFFFCDGPASESCVEI